MRALGLAIIAFVALQIYLGNSAELPPERTTPFVRNCPNIRMDGDNDGDACENDDRL